MYSECSTGGISAIIRYLYNPVSLYIALLLTGVIILAYFAHKDVKDKPKDD